MQKCEQNGKLFQVNILPALFIHYVTAWFLLDLLYKVSFDNFTIIQTDNF